MSISCRSSNSRRWRSCSDSWRVLSIEYEVRDPLWRRLGIALKLLAGAAGIYAAYLSQTRGAWIGIPVLLVITIFILGRNIPLRRQLALFVGGSAVLLALFASTDLVQKRAAEAKLDISQYQDGKSLDTSLGIRIQLWKASWLLYAEHPWVGVGREGYQSAMGELESRKIISPLARIQPHSHNEILYNMATLGTFGLLAILSLYLVPGYYFLREIAHRDREIRATAGMGLVLCAGFLILGLVDVMFMWGASDNFYSIVAAILFAFIIKRKKMLSVNPALQ